MSHAILLPVDLSDTASAAASLKSTLELLREGGILHVISVFPKFGSSQVANYFPPDFEQQALAQLGEDLRQWIKAHVPSNVSVHPHVMHGDIYHEILSAADKLGVDLIVISAHRPELKDYFLGSNAARIVRHAKQSVFVVRN